MKDTIIKFPEQFQEGFDAAKETGKELAGKKFKEILICGMGGSALPGELVKLLIPFLKIKIPVRVHKDYGLPPFVQKDSLIICISYSGNTEETLSAFKEALGKFSLVCVTSGGQLEKLSRQEGIPLALLPQKTAPRMALGYQFAALIQILENIKIISGSKEAILKAAASAEAEKIEERGKELAETIYGKIPTVLSSKKYFALAYIFKILLNENSKIPAFCNVFPELDHNEIQAFKEKEERVLALILKAEDDQERIQKRMQATAEIIGRSSQVEFVEIAGQDIFEKIIDSLLLFYWTSFHIAQKKHIDPLENGLIDELKEKLK